jgi:hypothetical protein
MKSTHWWPTGGIQVWPDNSVHPMFVVSIRNCGARWCTCQPLIATTGSPIEVCEGGRCPSRRLSAMTGRHATVGASLPRRRRCGAANITENAPGGVVAGWVYGDRLGPSRTGYWPTGWRASRASGRLRGDPHRRIHWQAVHYGFAARAGGSPGNPVRGAPAVRSCPASHGSAAANAPAAKAQS